MSELLQTNTVAALVQTADNICILGPAEAKSAPTELSVTVGNCVSATNLYHTSADAVLPHTAAGNDPAAVALAPNKVPAVFVQVVPGVNIIPVAQVLFAGCACKVLCKIKMENKKSTKLLVVVLITMIGFRTNLKILLIVS